MATILKSDELDTSVMDAEHKLWTYNGLDVNLTYEIFNVLHPLLKPEDTKKIYDFERGMLGPAMSMMRRGFRVDRERIQKLLHGNRSSDNRTEKYGLYNLRYLVGGMEKVRKGSKEVWEVTKKDALLQQYAYAVWDKPLNYRSPKQLKELLYERLNIPPYYSTKKGKSSVSTDTEALQKLLHSYPRGEPIARALLCLRDLDKQIGVLESQLDEDGRFRTFFDVAGTETGRWASRTSAYNTGNNLQNVTKDLRAMFIADEGYTLFQADLEQAESRAVAYLSGDENYIHACESGDLHTTVASMVFDIPADKEYADGVKYYKHFTYRDMAKRAGHGTNYGLTPHSLSRHMKIEVKQAFRFNLLYLGGELPEARAEKLELLDLPHKKEGKLVKFSGAFPKIREWQEDTIQELQVNGYLATPFPRKRVFWGRRDSSTTHREAIAYRPQSLVGDVLNRGLWSVWHDLESEGVRVLAQGHDAVIGQVPTDRRDELLRKVADRMVIPVPFQIGEQERVMNIPVEIKIGQNWRDMEDWNG